MITQGFEGPDVSLVEHNILHQDFLTYHEGVSSTQPAHVREPVAPGYLSSCLYNVVPGTP